jgi:hypothetical protein
MRIAEENSQFHYQEINRKEGEVEDDDDYEEADEEEEETVLSKLVEKNLHLNDVSKLENSKIKEKIEEDEKVSQAAAAMEALQKNIDLDLDLDIDLADVDTNDINLDDDLSDD